MTISVETTLTAHTWKDEATGVYVGYVPALDLYTQASSEDRIENAIRSLIWAHVTVAEQIRSKQG